jgi:hypothetical protein
MRCPSATDTASRGNSEPRVNAEARDAWRGALEPTLRAEADHPVWRSQSATACSAKTRHPAGAGNQYVLAQLTIDPQPPTLRAL